MLIQITKRADGAGVLRCVRDDGSVSWQKQTDRHAAFFALHDLTHFAVETTLRCKRGFFGLVAERWDIDDTTGNGLRGRLPVEAVQVESIVGLVFTEQAGGEIWSADDFNQALANNLTAAKIDAVRSLTQDELAAVRKRRSELFAEWTALAAAQTLELSF